MAVIIVAAGSGTRLGAGKPKAFVGLGNKTVLGHAVQGVLALDEVAQIILVTPASLQGEALTEAHALAGERAELISAVAGGDTRQASVAAGLGQVWADVDTVLVHDAARALTPVEVFERVIEAVRAGSPAVLPVLPVVDTLKRVAGADVVELVDRADLARAQTPQGFRRDVLETAYRVADQEFTDDAALVQHAGHIVRTVTGDERAFKITTPADLQQAQLLLAQSGFRPSESATAASAAPASAFPIPRVGIGTDVHAFSDEGTLWLAGLEWPGQRALAGHSDGDAVGHAIVDALLSAAGLGDIGTHFGTSRPEFAGAHAEAFLAETRRLVEQAGFRIGNVGEQIQAARPKMAGRRIEAEQALTAALGAPVSLSATTTDGLGFVGAVEGVQVFAVAMVVPA